jgi:hypothetical protein
MLPLLAAPQIPALAAPAALRPDPNSPPDIASSFPIPTSSLLLLPPSHHPTRLLLFEPGKFPLAELPHWENSSRSAQSTAIARSLPKLICRID